MKEARGELRRGPTTKMPPQGASRTPAKACARRVKPATPAAGDAESDATRASFADLAAVVAAWPDLPPAVRAGVAAMVGACR